MSRTAWINVIIGIICVILNKGHGKDNKDNNDVAVLVRLLNEVLSEKDIRTTHNYDWFGCKGEAWRTESQKGRIKSPNYGAWDSKYPNNVDCTWIIQLQTFQNINLEFSRLRIQDSSSCVNDWLEISRKNKDGEMEVIQTLCGTYKTSSLPAPINTQSNYVQIRFVTDRSTAENGFNIKWSMTEERFPGCDGVHAKYPTAPGTITSPAFHYGAYPGDMKCAYLIESPHGQKIQLSFTEFAIEGGEGCPYDFAMVFDGSSIYSPILRIACGDVIPKDVTSTGDTLSIFFKSDRSDNDKGFSADFKFIGESNGANSDPCDDTPAIITSDKVDIYSPNFIGNQYPNNVNCQWQIEVTQGKRIRLHFEVFSTEKSQSCSWDYLAIYSGNPDPRKTTAKEKLCGQSLPDDVIISENKAIIVFQSDNSTTDFGFHIKMTSETAAHNGIPDNTGDSSNWNSLDNNIDEDYNHGYNGILPGGYTGETVSSCDFEFGLCGWTNDADNKVAWVRHGAPDHHTYQAWLPERDVNPGNDQGHYVLSDTEHASKGDVGRLVSPWQAPTTGTGRCMRFAYFMEGYGMGGIDIKIQVGNKKEEKIIWSRSSDHGTKWYQAMAAIASNQNHHIVIEMITGLPMDSYISIDDISITEGACVSIPAQCAEETQQQEGDDGKRIMHGVLSKEGQWSFTAHIQANMGSEDEGFLQCGGSLISPQWVLTAAHCFEEGGRIIQDVMIHLGETSLVEEEDSNFLLRAAAIFIHPDRLETGVAPNDIALVKLPYAVHKTDSVNTICLLDEDLVKEGLMCTAIGWGGDQTGQTTTDLFHIEEVIMSHQECNDFWSDTHITDDMLCTLPAHPGNKQSVCSGDSGGPLVCEKDGRFLLAGVTSWITPCSDQLQEGHPTPSVFAKASHFNSWIQQTIADNSDQPIE